MPAGQTSPPSCSPDLTKEPRYSLSGSLTVTRMDRGVRVQSPAEHAEVAVRIDHGVDRVVVAPPLHDGEAHRVAVSQKGRLPLPVLDLHSSEITPGAGLVDWNRHPREACPRPRLGTGVQTGSAGVPVRILAPAEGRRCFRLPWCRSQPAWPITLRPRARRFAGVRPGAGWSGALELGRAGGHLEHLADALPGVPVEAGRPRPDLVALCRKAHQTGAGALVDRQRAQVV